MNCKIIGGIFSTVYFEKFQIHSRPDLAIIARNSGLFYYFSFHIPLEFYPHNLTFAANSKLLWQDNLKK